MFSHIYKDDFKDITDIDVDKAIVVETASTGFSSNNRRFSDCNFLSNSNSEDPNIGSCVFLVLSDFYLFKT